MDEAEREQARKGLCIWQTAYGLPWNEYCQQKAGHGYLCKEHHADLREYVRLRRTRRA